MCTNFWISPHNGKLPSRLAPAQCHNSLAPQLLSNNCWSKTKTSVSLNRVYWYDIMCHIFSCLFLWQQTMYYITEVVGICISRYRNTARLLKMYIKFLGNTRNPKLKGVCVGGGGGGGGGICSKCLYDYVILLEDLEGYEVLVIPFKYIIIPGTDLFWQRTFPLLPQQLFVLVNYINIVAGQISLHHTDYKLGQYMIWENSANTEILGLNFHFVLSYIHNL